MVNNEETTCKVLHIKSLQGESKKQIKLTFAHQILNTNEIMMCQMFKFPCKIYVYNCYMLFKLNEIHGVDKKFTTHTIALVTTIGIYFSIK